MCPQCPRFCPHTLIFGTWVCCHLLGTSSTTGPAPNPPGKQTRGHHLPRGSSDPLSFCFSPSNLSPPLADATTAAGWTTTPKSASSRRSPRNATSARASATWSPTARRKRSSPPARRESLPTSERRRTCTARPCSPKPGNDGRRRRGLPPGRRGFGKATGGHGGQEEGAGRGGGSPFSSPQPAFNWGGSKNGGGSARRTSCRGKRNTFASSLFSTKPGRRVPGRRSREAASQGGSRGSLLPLPRARRREGRGRQSWGTPTGRPRGSPSSSLAGLPASEPRSWAARRLQGLQVLKPAAGVLLVVFPSGKRNPAGAPAHRLFHVEQTHAGHEYSSCPCRVPETDGPWAQPAQGQREKGTRVSAAALVPPRCPPALPLFIGPGDNEFYNFILPGPAAPRPCRSQRQVKAALGCAWMTYLWVCLSSFFFFFLI